MELLEDDQDGREMPGWNGRLVLEVSTVSAVQRVFFLKGRH